MSKKIDMTGVKVNSLTVLSEYGRTPEQRTIWKCLCDCGNIAFVEGKKIRSGHTKTCGKCPRNTYYEKNGHMVGLTFKGEEFCFDKQDFALIKDHVVFIEPKGYVNIIVNGVCYKLHRLIMNPPQELEVDHINNNKIDNRRSNLRICTHRNNILNSSKRRNSSSRYKGVSWDKDAKKWRAYIGVKGKMLHLGLYDDEREAAKQYNQKALELFKEYAKLNDVSA